MKKLNITIEGSSLLAYITFFDSKIKRKLMSMERDDYDFIDFVTENKKKEVFLGRGFCMKSEPTIKILYNDNEIYNGPIYYNNNLPPNVSMEEMKTLFKEEHDELDFDVVISNVELKPFKADSHFFLDANKFKYVSLEKVECFGSHSSIDITVKDDFRFSDLKVRMVSVDSGESLSISDVICLTTSLEKQVCGIEYEGKIYEFEGGEDEGGFNEIVWFENNKGSWSESLEISRRIMELEGDESFTPASTGKLQRQEALTEQEIGILMLEKLEKTKKANKIQKPPTKLQSDFTYQSAFGEIMITGYTGRGHVVIPEHFDSSPLPVRRISAAFQDNQIIFSVEIPNGVTDIGSLAFYGCTSLKSISIPDSVSSIGYEAFNFCNSLTNIIIPDSVSSIGDRSFSNCTSLKSITIPKSITSIGDQVFAKCTSLKSITIPDRVTSIGSEAFFNCTSLKSITIPDSVTLIGDRAFDSCTSLKSITIPDSVTSIGDRAFDNCTSLTSITIPKSITSIGDQVFAKCTSLKSITIPDSVISIAFRAFVNCTSLKSITISKSITSIGDQVFAKCTGLTNISIPNGVTSIGSCAFYFCASLKSIAIPNSVTSIGNDSFSNCTGLKSIAIPDSVFSIGDRAFSNCTSLKSIEIPDSVSLIGDRAFEGCSAGQRAQQEWYQRKQKGMAKKKPSSPL